MAVALNRAVIVFGSLPVIMLRPLRAEALGQGCDGWLHQGMIVPEKDRENGATIMVTPFSWYDHALRMLFHVHKVNAAGYHHDSNQILPFHFFLEQQR